MLLLVTLLFQPSLSVLLQATPILWPAAHGILKLRKTPSSTDSR
jgi:hypothetical protein